MPYVTAEESGIELLVTVVAAAEDERDARTACGALLERIGGRIVASGDCSDEEPGCWSVTISRASDSTGPVLAAALARAVRSFLRELGPAYTRARVACEPPAAWAVLDDPDLIGDLVGDGERLLVEAWFVDVPDAAPWPDHAHRPSLPPQAAPDSATDPDEAEYVPVADYRVASTDEHGRPRARLGLRVDVVTERAAGAEWPARAVASRLSRTVTVLDRATELDSSQRPPMVRVAMDLGHMPGSTAQIIADAISVLGGQGWSRPQIGNGNAVARWSAASTPDSGIAAIELVVSPPQT